MNHVGTSGKVRTICLNASSLLNVNFYRSIYDNSKPAGLQFSSGARVLHGEFMRAFTYDTVGQFISFGVSPVQMNTYRPRIGNVFRPRGISSRVRERENIKSSAKSQLDFGAQSSFRDTHDRSN